jgi:hypothetical protein
MTPTCAPGLRWKKAWLKVTGPVSDYVADSVSSIVPRSTHNCLWKRRPSPALVSVEAERRFRVVTRHPAECGQSRRCGSIYTGHMVGCWLEETFLAVIQVTIVASESSAIPYVF